MKTLDEWIDNTEAAAMFRDNLEANISVFCEDMSEEEIKAFIRTTMIFFRQAVIDCGASK